MILKGLGDAEVEGDGEVKGVEEIKEVKDRSAPLTNPGIFAKQCERC